MRGVGFFGVERGAGVVAPETELAQTGLGREIRQQLLEERDLPGSSRMRLPFSRRLFARQKHGVEVDVIRMVVRKLGQQDFFPGSLASEERKLAGPLLPAQIVVQILRQKDSALAQCACHAAQRGQ